MPNPVQRRGAEICSENAVQEIANGHMRNQGAIQGNEMGQEAGFSSAPRQHQLCSSSPAGTWTKRTLNHKRSILKTVFGTISIDTKARRLRFRNDDDQSLGEEDHLPEYEYESSFNVYPALWLLKLGFNYGYHISTSSSPFQGWTNNIQPFTLVPDDALIFEFCKIGDLAAVRTLLSRNLASVRDSNSEGLTPLHVSAHKTLLLYVPMSDACDKIAAEWCHPELCNFLITAGADKSARTFGIWYTAPALGRPLKQQALFILTHCKGQRPQYYMQPYGTAIAPNYLKPLIPTDYS